MAPVSWCHVPRRAGFDPFPPPSRFSARRGLWAQADSLACGDRTATRMVGCPVGTTHAEGANRSSPRRPSPAGLGAHWRADGLPKTAYPQPGRRADRGPHAPPGIGGRAERLSLRRLRGLAHGQAPSARRPSGRRNDRTLPPPGAGSAPEARAPSAASTGTRPATRCSSASASAPLPSSAACSHESTPRRPSIPASGPPAATCGTPSTSCDSVPSACGRSAPTLPSGCPIWDENVVADVRSYDELSPVVGLIALIAAADDVAHRIARSTPRCARRRTPRPGPSAPSTSCSATPTRCAITSGTFAAPWDDSSVLETEDDSVPQGASSSQTNEQTPIAANGKSQIVGSMPDFSQVRLEARSTDKVTTTHQPS